MPGGERECREEEARPDDGGRRASEMHEEGREQRADRDPGAHQALENAEDAREDIGRGRSLEQRPP